MTALHRRHFWLAAALVLSGPVRAQLQEGGTAPPRGLDLPTPPTDDAGRPVDPSDPEGGKPIIPEAEFDAALPPLSGDINAPLEPMPSVPVPAAPLSKPVTAPSVAGDATTPIAVGDTIAAVPPEDPALAAPLAPIGSFETVPLVASGAETGDEGQKVRYETVVNGLGPLDLEGQFKSLSSLEDGDGKADNATQVAERAKEDESLAARLMKSLGYYDATAISSIETVTNSPGRLRAIVTASPGRLYTLSSITIDAEPVTPPDLLRKALPLKVGDAIDAGRIIAAEANVSLMLPQNGYPFVEVGDRDVLLDDVGPKPTGAYTLPVDTGPRSSFGGLQTTGDAVFGLDHLEVFPRFDRGDLYDIRRTDDLREALVATGLFSSVSVTPQKTGKTAADGTEIVDLLVKQNKGPDRSLAAVAGYSTGQGIRLEGSYTDRNRFPPEGALILSAVAGTQEQGAGATFRRSNAGRRDRTFSLIANASRQNYDAYNAIIGTLAVRWSYDSTPIWQKPLTYSYGGELTGTNESVYDFSRGERVRRTYGIVALPGQVVFDQSDSLLNPTKGYRLKLNFSPETSVNGGISPYVRTMAEGTVYYPTGDSLVIAGRVRAGSIFNIARDDLAPSRRYYGGGGGSVRGYGYQRLGPFDPNGDPVGGRSINEFSLEARYRFGNFGIVPFIDGGNAYESSLPKFSDFRLGAGIGGRFYTNFGPFRVDVATPLNPRPGDGKIALYISIGQAF